jgi:adenosylcobinamide-GDP ribazoletransferase
VGGLGIKALLIAIQFLTIVSLAPRLAIKDADMTRSFSCFPVVGAMLGGAIFGVDLVFRGLFPAPLMGVIEVATLAFLTRGLHLDGLADTFDALGSGRPAEDALLVMKDSNIGALGAVSLILILSLKASAFSAVSQKGLWQVFVLAPCLSRWSMNVLAAASEYARPEGGLGMAFVGRKTWPGLVFAGLSAILFSWFLLGKVGVTAFAYAVIWGLAAAFYYKRRFGGVTGDVLGAHLELTEIMLIIAGAGLPKGSF